MSVTQMDRYGVGGTLLPPPRDPPILSSALPVHRADQFSDIRNGLFETGHLSGDQADVWAWRIVHGTEMMA